MVAAPQRPDSEPEECEPAETEADGYALAQAAYEEAGTQDGAIALLLSWMADDEALAARLMEPFRRHAAMEYVKNAIRAKRPAFWRQPRIVPPTATVQQADALVSSARRSLYDYPLSHGWRLGDADAEMLREEERLHTTQARSQFVRGKWFGLIRRGLKGKEKVRERYTHDDLAALQRKAEVAL